jgi:lipid II:glycine glycyltransferase (peptidoglycan interpeptide bridge formation enzyme)
VHDSSAVFLESLVPSSLEYCNTAPLFLQSGFWGGFKSLFGWDARPFQIRWKAPYNETSASLLVMHRRLAFGFSFAYVPWGPILPPGFPEDADSRSTLLCELAREIRPHLSKSVAFLRFDPPWYSKEPKAPEPQAPEPRAPVLKKPLLRSAADIQAPDTVLIDLDKSEEEILAGMKSQWRYNQRFTLKKGVTIRRVDEEGLDAFYSLLQITSLRQSIAIHQADYYKKLFSHYRDYDQKDGKPAALHLYLAEHEGEALAAIVVLFWGEEAVYMYAASSDHKRNLMPSFALQIQAILDARSAGCKEYDLFGIPPNDNPNHPMAGLYRFKTGFGGSIVHRPGSWDYLYRPLAARIFRAAEGFRKSLRDRKKIKSHHAT